jgi:NADP-dependent 3-hydroxy acid dehydrogenase YdfG
LTAVVLAAAGWSIILMGRCEEVLEETAKLCSSDVGAKHLLIVTGSIKNKQFDTAT